MDAGTISAGLPLVDQVDSGCRLVDPPSFRGDFVRYPGMLAARPGGLTAPL